MSLKSEILEQPEVLDRVIPAQREPAHEIARAIRGRGVHSIFVAARGTSDNAALYGKYLWGSLNRLPVALAAPSLFTLYRTPPALAGSLVVGISQSGQSPDIVSVLAEGRRQGALTLAITNDTSSPLAQEAEMVLHTAAGSERSVAATKTYTTQLLSIAMVAVALRDERALFEELLRLPQLMAETLTLDRAIESAAQRYKGISQCVVLGRGYNYATAYEWSLKLKELAYVVAEPFSPADLQHGPVAMLSPGFPVLAVAPRGAVFEGLRSLLEKLVRDYEVDLLSLSNEETALRLARTPFRLPSDLPEWLSPLVAIVPAQLFCYHLTRERGYDTETPRRLTKVTRTW